MNRCSALKEVLLSFLGFLIISNLSARTFDNFIRQVLSASQNQQTALVDSFMNANPQLPYLEQDTLCYFIYRGSANQVTVAGDVNSWNPNLSPLTRLSTTNFWYRKEVFEADARLDYKFILNGSKWILDPHNSYQSIGGFGPNSELRMPDYPPPPEVEYYADIPHGSIWDTTFYSSILNNSRTIKIYVPASYNTNTDSFSVVLFHDGLDYLKLAKAKNVLDYLIARQRIQPVIGIFVPPVNRSPEYAGNLQNKFTSFIVNEIIPFVDNKFRTRKNPAFRSIMGASSGGNISLWIGYNHPDIFGHIGAYSSYIQGNLFSGFQNSPNPRFKLYLEIGSYDIPGLIPMVRSFIAVILANGYEYRYLEIHDGHSWANWRGHIDDALQFFFPGAAFAFRENNITSKSKYTGLSYLNSFNPFTQIRFFVHAMAFVRVEIFNVQGKLVRTLFEAEVPSGNYTVAWDGRNNHGKLQSSGLYIYRLKIDDTVIESKRFVFIK